MRPEPQRAMRATLHGGPGHCPPDLFAGDVATVVRGLKVHANQIHHSRHVALEETYPRLRALMGHEDFHTAAERHLANADVLGRRLDLIGRGFAAALFDRRERDLANVEWAWLVSFHAAEAMPLTMADIAASDPESLLALTVARHPAADWIDLYAPREFAWNGEHAAFEAVLVTRPDSEVLVAPVTGEHRATWEAIRIAIPFARLLEMPNAATPLFGLIAAGAITLAGVEP